MKSFALIFSIYILVLTALPCVDGPEDHCMQQDQKCQTDNTNHQDDIDHCSPFCTCNCCVSPIVVVQSFAIHFERFAILQAHYASFTSSYTSTIFSSIWQPPKLV